MSILKCNRVRRILLVLILLMILAPILLLAQILVLPISGEAKSRWKIDNDKKNRTNNMDGSGWMLIKSIVKMHHKDALIDLLRKNNKLKKISQSNQCKYAKKRSSPHQLRFVNLDFYFKTGIFFNVLLQALFFRYKMILVFITLIQFSRSVPLSITMRCDDCTRISGCK